MKNFILEENVSYPKVLVGIVTFNRSVLLSKTLDEIYKQNYFNFEVVVFDNGCIDNTQIVLKFFDKVTVIKSVNNINIVDARNYLMSNYDADYYFGLDDDAWPLNNNLMSTSVDYLESNPNVAILGMDILSPIHKESVYTNKKPFINSSFIACGCMLRKSVIEKSGYYSKSIGYYGPEEDDLSLKVMDLGYDVVTYPGLFIWHETSPISRDYRLQWKSQVGNILALMFKHYPMTLLLPLFIVRILSLLVYSVRKRLFVAFLKGTLDFIKNLPNIIKQRKSLKFSTVFHFHKLIRQKK